MAAAPSKKDEILEVAENLIRTAGYNGFSTRDIANAVGIKAASVHYHFPAKADIGVAVTERYTERFIGNLGAPENYKDPASKPLDVYINAFRQALITDRNLCLCAVLGAESGGLPEQVSCRTRIFFEKNLEWLRAVMVAALNMSAEAARQRAALVLSSLEGALILSMSLDDPQLFEDVAAGLV